MKENSKKIIENKTMQILYLIYRKQERPNPLFE
jgi:hypothetical protein